MKHVLSLSLVLLWVWLWWSGLSWPWAAHYQPLLLAMGIVSLFLVVLVATRMGLVDEEGAPFTLITWRLALYIPWLAAEIAKANIDVTRRILHPRLPIAPRLIDVAAGQRSKVAQVIYANSITLTPGTISVLVGDGTITVHALSREAAEGLQTGEMNQRVINLERPA
ncbi:MAG: Na+/H+ antiporter subunit E [Acidobacteriota bacterium]